MTTNVSPNVKPPVFIEYTPEYKKSHGLSNEPDRIPTVNLVRIPEKDTLELGSSIKEFSTQPAMLKAKMPSPEQITKGIAVIPVVLETGKEILIKIFDIRDIWEDRKGNKNNPNDKFMLISQEVADVLEQKV